MDFDRSNTDKKLSTPRISSEQAAICTLFKPSDTIIREKPQRHKDR